MDRRGGGPSLSRGSQKKGVRQCGSLKSIENLVTTVFFMSPGIRRSGRSAALPCCVQWRDDGANRAERSAGPKWQVAAPEAQMDLRGGGPSFPSGSRQKAARRARGAWATRAGRSEVYGETTHKSGRVAASLCFVQLYPEMCGAASPYFRSWVIVLHRIQLFLVANSSQGAQVWAPFIEQAKINELLAALETCAA